jgi:L-lactate dehydrogenase complex protein LldE
MEVQLFVTCLVDVLAPQVGEAAVSSLEAAGCGVSFAAGQTCCGQPAFNAGFNREAAAMARHTIDVLLDTDLPVVVPSGSCTDMIVHHYPELLADDEEYGFRAEALASRTKELTQFLVDDVASGQEVVVEGTVAYHPSCHGLRNLGISHQPDTLLASSDRVDLGAETEVCCGFGGVFSVKRSDVSGELLARKLDAIEASGAQTVCGGDVGCLMHLEGGARRRGMDVVFSHIAGLLEPVSAEVPDE